MVLEALAAAKEGAGNAGQPATGVSGDLAAKLQALEAENQSLKVSHTRHPLDSLRSVHSYRGMLAHCTTSTCAPLQVQLFEAGATSSRGIGLSSPGLALALGGGLLLSLALRG